MERFAGRVSGWLAEAQAVAPGWITLPAAWLQSALLAVADLLARVLAGRMQPAVRRVVQPKAETAGLVARVRRTVLWFLPLLRPLLAYALTATVESVTRATFGAGEVIAFGKRVFLFLAARTLVREVLREGFLKLPGRFVLIPVAALCALGVLDDITARPDETVIALGSIRFSVLALICGVIAGALLFWPGAWSNRQSAGYIKAREELRPATREPAIGAAKFEMPHPRRVVELRTAPSA